MTGADPAPGTRSLGCLLCGAAAEPFLRLEGRDYFRCPACGLRFLDPARHPAREAEDAHYLHHENDPGDPGYRRFLSRLAGPLLARIAPGSRGLDYGCGPGPALAAMLREAGHDVALWDPFFAPDPAPLAACYDFVTCTEVAEHFHRPAQDFARLRALVRPGGWLALMTCFQTDDARFAAWHYRKDPTHVAFYREATFRHLAARWGWVCDVPAKDVVLMQRPAPGRSAAAGADRSRAPITGSDRSPGS
ncbi:MAG: class I SAM-dependent methyltransferase [Gemmobacter sp.]